MVDLTEHKKALQDATFQVEAAESYLEWTRDIFRAMKETRSPRELKRMAEMGMRLSDAGNTEAGSARVELQRMGAL